MKQFIPIFRLEGLGIALLAAASLYNTDTPVWVLLAAFLVFDFSAIGYAINTKTGAVIYNTIHNYFAPATMLSFGLLSGVDLTIVISSCWLFHVGIDRMLGYGLKHSDSFTHTHLGRIGNSHKKQK